MSRGKYLDKRAKEIILDRMRMQGEMTTAEIMDMIRPHYYFDAQEAREQGIRRQANRLVKSLRDEQGVRTCFAVKEQDIYVNIERCTNRAKVSLVEAALQKQIDGLIASRNKANRRRQELDGQLSLEASEMG